MSRCSKLASLLEDGKLFELESLFTGDETARTMIVTADIDAVVHPPFADTEEGERHGALRDWCDNWLEGGEFTVAENPDDKPRDAMIARVHPVDAEIWSLRVTDPDDTPGIRVLCAFAGQDKLIALTWEFREDMGDFDERVEEAIARWKDLFGTEPPFKGDHLHDYLTNFRAV